MLDTGADEKRDCVLPGHRPRRAVPEGPLSLMIKKLLLLTTLAAGLMMFAATPATAQYPTPPNASVDDTGVLAGGTVNISGQCFDDDIVDVFLEGELLGSIPVDADGNFSGPITIPSDTPPGTYTLEAVCGDTVLPITITVGAAGVTPPPSGGNPPGGGGTGPLARTGSEVDGLLKIGGGLLLAGAAAVLVTTKRRRATA